MDDLRSEQSPPPAGEPAPAGAPEAVPRARRLAFRLFWSHSVLALILLAAVGITLWGLFGMNAMIAEVKNQYLADFEEEEQLHRSAWAVEIAARHGAGACEDPELVATNVRAATRELEKQLNRHAAQVSPAMARAAAGYMRFGQHVSERDVCQRLSDEKRKRLLLDEELTNSWISKLKELRIAITEKELAAQHMGRLAIGAGLALGGLALVAAALIARSTARGVTVPLALIAKHAERLGEGDFAPMPSIHEPLEVAQLSAELDRMRARLAEVNQLKQAFLGSVSHDLRTPLAHMREALSLLLDGTVGTLNPKQQRVAALALRACEREIRLVSALLDLSRIRSGRPLRLTEGQRIDDIIASALESVQETAQRAEVMLKRQAERPVPDVCVDAVLVETAVANVLTNAIAASPKGGDVTIRRELVAARHDGTPSKTPWLRISVSDQGAGVASAMRTQIFEPFFTTKVGVESSGSGLGLPLAREMIRAHGGELILQESGGQGALFTLWLPTDNRDGHDPQTAQVAFDKERS